MLPNLAKRFPPKISPNPTGGQNTRVVRYILWVVKTNIRWSKAKHPTQAKAIAPVALGRPSDWLQDY